MMATIPDISRALSALGEQLAAEGEEASIVVVGGAALNLSGVVARTTRDVDVIARATATNPPHLIHPDPLPPALERAVRTVSRDLRLPMDWLNTVVASQWRTGLPPGFEGRIEWRMFSNLHVGIAGRRDLIFLKLYAAADDVGPESVHYQDLVALEPTTVELEAAAEWIRSQDTSPAFALIVQEVVHHVLAE